MPILVEALISKGLSILGNAVLAKGQDVVEEKLGIKLKPDASPEELASYRKAEIEHEEFLLEISVKKIQLELEAEKVAQSNVTDRWKADMLSDSWMSKNIRPMVLLILLSTYFLFAVLSGFKFLITQSYVELLAQMLMLVMGAYFAGRTVEKIVDMTQKGKRIES